MGTAAALAACCALVILVRTGPGKEAAAPAGGDGAAYDTAAIIEDGVQQGRVLLTVFHKRPSFPVSLDGGGGEKFPLASKKLRSFFRPRLMRDFTVPISTPRTSPISS